MCNHFSLEIRALLRKVLPDSALANFTTMIMHRSQNFQNTTLPISAQCAMTFSLPLRRSKRKVGWFCNSQVVWMVGSAGDSSAVPAPPVTFVSIMMTAQSDSIHGQPPNLDWQVILNSTVVNWLDLFPHSSNMLEGKKLGEADRAHHLMHQNGAGCLPLMSLAVQTWLQVSTVLIHYKLKNYSNHNLK